MNPDGADLQIFAVEAALGKSLQTHTAPLNPNPQATGSKNVLDEPLHLAGFRISHVVAVGPSMLIWVGESVKTYPFCPDRLLVRM